jgi:hypothetical protein
VLFAGTALCLRAQSKDSLQLKDFPVFEQTRYRHTGIVTGFHIQHSLHNDVPTLRYMEIGLASTIHQYGRHGPVSTGFYFSEEIYPGSDPVFGTKLGIFTHFLIDLGFSAVFYTDFKYGNFKLRPEMGIGLGDFRAVVGINIPTIRNRDFYRLQKNYGQISFQYCWPVKKTRIGTERSFYKDQIKKKTAWQ